MSLDETCPPSFLDQTQKFEREGYENIDEIISVTDFAKDSLVRIFGIIPEKITRIYNGISMPRLQKDVKELRKSFGISPHEKIILFAGKIAENKGIITLLDAFEMLIEQGFTNARLIFAGKGNFDLLFKRSQKSAMQITILGDVGKETLSNLYQIADVGVVPSYIEQCSFTAIEMMAHGLPLIVANIDGLKEIVPKKYKYKFDIDMTPNIVIPNIISLYLFLKELISTDNQVLSQNLIQHVQKRLTNINMFESTLRLYEKTLSSAILLSNNPNKLESPKNTTKSSDFSPLVSVILPVYNGEAYIAECIDSILSQTFSEFELIIINDGSLDKTDEIVNSIKDYRIRYFKFKTNKGITNALNKGLRESKSNYIGRIDADDLMHKDRLKTQFDYLSENPKVGVVASWYKIINAEGMNIGSVDHDLTSTEIKFTLMFKNIIGHPTTMFRKDCLGKLFYRNKYKKCEDYDLWERIISNQKDIVILKEYLTKYRLHSNNYSSTLSNEVEDSIAQIISRQLFKYFPSVNDKQMVLHLAKSLNKTTGHNQEKQFNDYINQLISLSNNGINRDKLIGILN
jgi:glycosyltransferase involved in cell wall biosynthesis